MYGNIKHLNMFSVKRLIVLYDLYTEQFFFKNLLYYVAMFSWF